VSGDAAAAAASAVAAGNAPVGEQHSNSLCRTGLKSMLLLSVLLLMLGKLTTM